MRPVSRSTLLIARLWAEAPDMRPDWVDEPMLRPSQVAMVFQVSRRTVSDWARTGKLAWVMTPGGHRRFPASAVCALVESMQVVGMGTARSR